MAQRFPTDYDGVISRVPVINWTALQHAGHRTGVAQQNGGWMNAAKVALVSQAVLRACDSLDGLADGVVSNYQGCGSKFDPEALRCPSSLDTGDACLSERQLSALNTLHSSFELPFAVANGVRAYPAYGYSGETQSGGFFTWFTGTHVAAFPPPSGGGQGQLWSFGNGAIRYFVMRDRSADPFTYSPESYADRVRQISDLMDSTNPDLSAFAAHGGKLILKEHMADYAQSPFAGIGYYQTVVTRMGQRAVDQFVRLYVTPGVGHGGSGVSGTTGVPIPQYVDLLGTLDDWVDRKNPPPSDLVQTSVAAAPPFAVIASRPMCTFPTYPQYGGSGDPKLASSFTCTER
jgi:feruloyl esterase